MFLPADWCHTVFHLLMWGMQQFLSPWQHHLSARVTDSKDPSLPLQERIEAAAQNRTDSLRLSCKKSRLSCWCCDAGTITQPFWACWHGRELLSWVWWAVIQYLQTLIARFIGVKERSVMIPGGFGICTASSRNWKRSWNNQSSVVTLQMFAALLFRLAQLPGFPWDKRGLEKN